MTSKFDYVKYDDAATAQQTEFKQLFMQIDELVEKHFADCGFTRSRIGGKLEEAYMWVGKAIRDRQIERSKNAAT